MTDVSGNLLDELLIRQRIELSGRRMDDGDATGFAALFAERGVFRVTGRELVGRQAIIDFLVDDRAFDDQGGRWQDGAGPSPRGIHQITSPVIEVDGDRATSECDCVTFHRNASGEPTIGYLCRYRDRWVREEGGWLIDDRAGVSVRRRDETELVFLPRSVRGG